MKAAPILICPTTPLRHLPPAERDVLRRVFTQVLRGMDRRHHARFMRLVREIFYADAGEGFQLFRMEERSGPLHRRHRVILERLFQSQERYRDIEKMHDWIKVGAGFVTWQPGRDYKPVAIPRSTSFEVCSEDEMREYHAAAVEFLRTPYALRRLFTHVRSTQRAEMLETVLANPEEQPT
jgi:hypothetical protein